MGHPKIHEFSVKLHRNFEPKNQRLDCHDTFAWTVDQVREVHTVTSIDVVSREEATEPSDASNLWKPIEVAHLGQIGRGTTVMRWKAKSMKLSMTGSGKVGTWWTLGSAIGVQAMRQLLIGGRALEVVGGGNPRVLANEHRREGGEPQRRGGAQVVEGGFLPLPSYDGCVYVVSVGVEIAKNGVQEVGGERQPRPCELILSWAPWACPQAI